MFIENSIGHTHTTQNNMATESEQKNTALKWLETSGRKPNGRTLPNLSANKAKIILQL